MKSSSIQNTAGGKVFRFFNHHENTVLTSIDKEKPNFIKNANNGIKLRKKKQG